nr:MAG TPA: hypothetical protein [Caudoviricetes sp.]
MQIIIKKTIAYNIEYKTLAISSISFQLYHQYDTRLVMQH